MDFVFGHCQILGRWRAERVMSIAWQDANPASEGSVLPGIESPSVTFALGVLRLTFVPLVDSRDLEFWQALRRHVYGLYVFPVIEMGCSRSNDWSSCFVRFERDWVH